MEDSRAFGAAKQAGKNFLPLQTPSIFCLPAWDLLLKNFWRRGIYMKISNI